MKLFETIRAIFNFRGKRAELELKSAEIRGDKVYMHPADDPDHTFCVSGKAIDILIDPSVALTEDDFLVIDNQKLNKLQATTDNDSSSPLDNVVHPQQTPSKQQKKMPENTLNPTEDSSAASKSDKESAYAVNTKADENPQKSSVPEASAKPKERAGADTNAPSRQSEKNGSTQADGQKRA